VTEGIRTGVFRDVDPDTATLAIFGICNWACQWWWPGGSTKPRRHRAGDVEPVISPAP
jgi:TetR/AcrR family transcriptional regulator, cholesterol catabolism regulator